jgi:hypothetical protein
VRTAALASGVIDEHVIERLLWPQAHG